MVVGLLLSVSLAQTPPPPPQSPLADAPSAEPAPRQSLKALPPESSPVRPPTRPERTAVPWVLAGAGVATGIGGGVAMALATDARARLLQAPLDTPGTLREQLLAQERTYTSVGIVLLCSAAIFMVASFVVFLLEAR
jgi:hypothetical protein